MTEREDEQPESEVEDDKKALIEVGYVMKIMW